MGKGVCGAYLLLRLGEIRGTPRTGRLHRTHEALRYRLICTISFILIYLITCRFHVENNTFHVWFTCYPMGLCECPWVTVYFYEMLNIYTGNLCKTQVVTIFTHRLCFLMWMSNGSKIFHMWIHDCFFFFHKGNPNADVLWMSQQFLRGHQRTTARHRINRSGIKLWTSE